MRILLITVICHVRFQLKLVGVNRAPGEGLLRDFNYGYLMKVNINGMQCICGKDLQLHNMNHAMCAACGLVTIYVKKDVLLRRMSPLVGKKGQLHLPYQLL